jgi:predicted nucleotidyltransferase
MKRVEAIAKLETCADGVKAFGVTSLYLFGSSARDAANLDSDIDLFVDYDPARKFSLLDLAAIKRLLEERLAVEVDVTTSR